VALQVVHHAGELGLAPGRHRDVVDRVDELRGSGRSCGGDRAISLMRGD
jgi:hypothetical protein